MKLCMGVVTRHKTISTQMPFLVFPFVSPFIFLVVSLITGQCHNLLFEF